MGKKKGNIIFNSIGIIVILFWLASIGVLVKDINFKTEETLSVPEEGTFVIDSAQREWREIYLKDKKVGYSVNIIKPFDLGYYIQEEIFLKLNLMGMGSGMYSYSRSRVDKQYKLQNFQYGLSSGAVSFNIQGKVEGDYIILKTGKGKDKKTSRIKLAGIPMLGTGMGHFFKSREIKVGDTFKFPIFDPSSMAQKETNIRVAEKEKVRIYQINYDAYRLEAELFGKTLNFWIDEEGSILKEQGFMGMTTIKSSAARAPRDLETEGIDDLYDLTAVETSRNLIHPEKFKYLKIKIEGIEQLDLNSYILNSERQKYDQGIMEITQEKPNQKAPYGLIDVKYENSFQQFLKPEFNVESDDEEIIRTAREITGEDDNPVRAARKLLNWVYRNIDKKPVISVPSAKEVLRTRVGDCNEHATLLVALLRASKIPARFSIGLVYTRGKFYYHAWTEAYLGRWLSLDATINQMPVDATHIKFIQGNLDQQVEIAGLIGNIKFEILDFRK